MFIIIGLSITCIYLGIKLHICNNKKLPEFKSSIQLDSGLLITPSSTYKDTNGAHHIVIDDRINSIIENQATKAANDLVPILEQVASNLGVKPSQIQSATTITSEASRDSVVFLRRQLDNAQKQTFFYKDKYLTLSVNTNPRDTVDLGSFDYKYDADLNIVQYNKKNWLLGAKKSYTDISSNDPNATIMGVKRFTVEQKHPEYGLRLQAALGYNGVTGAISAGPAVRVDLGKIKGSLRAGYLYNTQTQKFGFTASFDKDIKRF